MASNGFGRVRFLPIFEYFVDYKALLGFASYIFDGGGGCRPHAAVSRFLSQTHLAPAASISPNVCPGSTLPSGVLIINDIVGSFLDIGAIFCSVLILGFGPAGAVLKS